MLRSLLDRILGRSPRQNQASSTRAAAQPLKPEPKPLTPEYITALCRAVPGASVDPMPANPALVADLVRWGHLAQKPGGGYIATPKGQTVINQHGGIPVRPSPHTDR